MSSNDRWLGDLVGDLTKVRAAMKAHRARPGMRVGSVLIERVYVAPSGRQILEWSAKEAKGMIAGPEPDA